MANVYLPEIFADRSCGENKTKKTPKCDDGDDGDDGDDDGAGVWRGIVQSTDVRGVRVARGDRGNRENV